MARHLHLNILSKVGLFKLFYYEEMLVLYIDMVDYLVLLCQQGQACTRQVASVKVIELICDGCVSCVKYV